MNNNQKKNYLAPNNEPENPDEVFITETFWDENGKLRDLKTVDEWLDAYYSEYISRKNGKSN